MAKGEHGFLKFVCGVTIGVGLGILFAPQSGEKTRKELKSKLEEFANSVKDIDAEDVKRALSKKVKEIKKELKELDGEEIANMAKIKATQLVQKAGELVDLAKEKAEPVVQKAAEEVKEKAVIVLQNAIDKLEKDKKTKKIS